ncbi:glycoside hydrolase family 18 [Bacteroides uniformis]|nr:glycoside hydrolase family 18 [Bacteroides uniformis]
MQEYKNSDHKIVYGWFDNSEKVPFSRGQHMSDVPDSLDVIIATTPDLAEFELEDIANVHEKGTKVFYSISYDNILKEHTDKVKEGTETSAFSAYLSAELNRLIALEAPFDGIVAEYRGSNPIYMSEADKAEAKANRGYFLRCDIQLEECQFGVSNWCSRGILPTPIGQSVLSSCDHIILITNDATDVAQLGIEALEALMADGVPADRFIVSASTVSLDTTDKTTGYYNALRALSEAAYWVTEPSAEFTKAGLAIENMQNDYYNATNTYQYVREAINIMNPAPKKIKRIS